MIPNRLGYATGLEFTFKQNMIDVSSFGDVNPVYIAGNQQIEFTLSGIVTANNQVLDLLKSWVYDGINAPTYLTEWMCLYCGSPNSIKKTHCIRCGAPRNFILG